MHIETKSAFVSNGQIILLPLCVSHTEVTCTVIRPDITRSHDFTSWFFVPICSHYYHNQRKDMVISADKKCSKRSHVHLCIYSDVHTVVCIMCIYVVLLLDKENSFIHLGCISVHLSIIHQKRRLS